MRPTLLARVKAQIVYEGPRKLPVEFESWDAYADHELLTMPRQRLIEILGDVLEEDE